MQEISIKELRKLSITCKKCKTQVIADIGKSIANCPCCYAKFDDCDDSPYMILNQAINYLRQNPNADFSLVYDERL